MEIKNPKASGFGAKVSGTAIPLAASIPKRRMKYGKSVTIATVMLVPSTLFVTSDKQSSIIAISKYAAPLTASHVIKPCAMVISGSAAKPGRLCMGAVHMGSSNRSSTKARSIAAKAANTPSASRAAAAYLAQSTPALPRLDGRRI